MKLAKVAVGNISRPVAGHYDVPRIYYFFMKVTITSQTSKTIVEKAFGKLTKKETTEINNKTFETLLGNSGSPFPSERTCRF